MATNFDTLFVGACARRIASNIAKLPTLLGGGS
jgi:hypothetical protein